MEVIKANRQLKKLKVVSNLLNISFGSHVVCRAQFENHYFESNTITNYFFRMIWIGYKRPIVSEDLWDLDRADKSGRVSRHFLHIWNQEKEKCRLVSV